MKLPRKDVEIHHEQYAIQHTILQAASHKEIISQFHQLKEENKWLKQQVAMVTQDLTDLNLQQTCFPACPPVFTVTNFEQHRIDNDVWHSSPFYTHPKGYRMCMVIFANGFDNHEDTHTAAGVCLVKGEFDDQLKWPFQGYITIQLLSQEDSTYLETVLSFTGTEPDYDNIASRVTIKEEQIAENKWGAFDFISHSDLQPKYLKNDCLKFCVYQYTRL